MLIPADAVVPLSCGANSVAPAGESDCYVTAQTYTETDILYTEDECKAEAARCIKCKCDACDSNCNLIRFYKKWPVKMRDEIFLSVKPAGSLVHKCPSRKYIAACTHCTMMENACPEYIDLCGMINSARHQMHKVDKMPAAYRQYFINDMDFANGEFAKILRKGGSYAFFPGCNLGALNPEYVVSSYKCILKQYPDAGLLLRCCGIPADWAENTEKHQEEIRQLRSQWIEIGSPVLITACMSCAKHLNEYLPEIETISLYELYARCYGLPAQTGNGTQACDNIQACDNSRTSGNPPNSNAIQDSRETFTVFDPCSARGLDSVQAAVRDIAEAKGLKIEELPKNDQHGCCGFGGQGSIAQPDFAKFVTEERAAMSDNLYLVYCSNCRDVFNAEGKKAVHVLDVMFNIDPEGTAQAPELTDR